MRLDRIVVGLDGSPGSRAALSWAAAHLGKGPLAAVYGMSQLAELAWASIQVDTKWILEEADSLMEGTWCEPASSVGVDCVRFIREEEPAEALLAAAEEIDADLVAVGTHSHARWAPHYLGSVGAKLLHRAVTPVAVVPAETVPVAGTGRVLVGVDGSPAARRALAWAARATADTTAELEAVWVIDERLFHVSGWVPAIDRGQIETDMAGALAAEVEAALDETGLDLAVKQTVAFASPGIELAERSWSVDLVVLGLGHSGHLPDLVIGSVPRRCATQGGCPVIFVPSHPAPSD